MPPLVLRKRASVSSPARVLGWIARLIWAPFFAILVVIAPLAILLLTLVTIAGLLLIALFVGVLHQPGFPWGVVLGVSALAAMLAVLLQDVTRRF